MWRFRQHLLSNVFRSPPGEGGGEAEVVAPVVLAPKEREPTPYEVELRREAQKHRLAKNEADAKLESEAKRWKAESDAAVEAATKAGTDRLMRAELKAEAIKAGIADLEFLKLADLSKLKLNDAGEIEGAEAFFVKMKADKPAWFAARDSTSSTAKPPSDDGGKKFDARTATEAEYEAAKRKLISGR